MGSAWGLWTCDHRSKVREGDTLELINVPTQVQGLGSGVSLDTVEVCPMYRFWEVWSPLKLWRCYPRHRVWEGVSLENVDCEPRYWVWLGVT